MTGNHNEIINEDRFTPEMRELYKTMSDISEDCYYAGWMHGLEFAIWGALRDGDRSYGIGEMDADHLEQCRLLSEKTGGWIVWYGDEDDASLPLDEWGPRFIRMAEWLDKVKS